MEGLVIECNICGGIMPPEGGHDCAQTVEALRARLAAAKERADRLAAENEALRGTCSWALAEVEHIAMQHADAAEVLTRCHDIIDTISTALDRAAGGEQ